MALGLALYYNIDKGRDTCVAWMGTGVEEEFAPAWLCRGGRLYLTCGCDTEYMQLPCSLARAPVQGH